MASELYVVQAIGSTDEPPWDLGGVPCRPAAMINRPLHNAVAERRSRPTGESGPGPYFHTYKQPDSGVSHAFRRKLPDQYLVVNGKREYERDSNGTHYYYLTEAFGNGYYSFSYHSSPKGSYSVESGTMRILAILEPFTDRRNETMFFGSEYYETYRTPAGNPQMGKAYWFKRFQEKLRQVRQEASLAIILQRRVIVNNLNGDLMSTGEYTAPIPQIRYRYNEEDVFEWCMLTGGLSHHCESLASAAYIAAVDNLPGATCNSIATVIESMNSLAGLFKGEPPKTPKNIKDLWLSYRYAISTTKADISEYAETTRRLMALANASQISSSGQADDGKISCQATIKVDPSTCIPSDAKSWLKSYGFRLSAVNAWDMVPFSFVVDWFLHIGDILSYLENFGDALRMPVDEIWYSFRTNYEGQDTYFRVPGKVYFALPYVSYGETSGKVIGKRILDSIALFT